MRAYSSTQPLSNPLSPPLIQGLLIAWNPVGLDFIDGSSVPFRSWSGELTTNGLTKPTQTKKRLWPLKVSFAIHLAAINDSDPAHSGHSHHNQDPGCPPPSVRPRRTLPARKDCFTRMQQQQPSSTPTAAA